MISPIPLVAVAATLANCESLELIFNPSRVDSLSHANLSLPIDISNITNNRAFGMEPGDADFDGIGSGYPAQYMPPSNFNYDGVNYMLPQYKTSGNDNVVAQGQEIAVPPGRYMGVRMLAASETAIAEGLINATYADDSTTSGAVFVGTFWSWPYPQGGDLIFPYYLKNNTQDYNRSMIFQTDNWIDPSKDLTSLKLPNSSSGSSTGVGGAAQATRLHIFALSLIPATARGPSLSVQFARSTNKWIEGTNKTQIIEATIANVGTEWIFANHSVQVTVDSPGLKTVVPATIHRLRPGDRTKVQVGVVNADGVAEGTPGQARLLITGHGLESQYSFNATCGFVPYEPTYESVYRHESPNWYSDAKYGIFLHWGPASVPAWGNSGANETYPFWYWWSMNQGPGHKDGTYEYNLKTYGPNHTYDEFFNGFTASEWNPKEWLDLFEDSGAKYFVQVSKHHDGYAIYDLPRNVTERTSVVQPPHRNLLGELFDAAEKYYPKMHKAAYFSLPEWFNPAYAKYGFASWPGGNATNPYNNETLEYTGFVDVDDYIQDIMLPEMRVLGDMGSEIMWCDIGGPNATPEFAAKWYNEQAAQGKQVVMNNRCGVPGDFDTPEYARYAAIPTRLWESNLGMDPFAYGFNRATPLGAFMKAETVVTSLVDIVSKNGIFLLDVGPMENGTILQVEQDNLRAAGKWIKDHGEAIYSTQPWYITPEEGPAVRFTNAPNAFYILTIFPPNSTLVLDSPVPFYQGDEVTVVGGKQAGSVVPAVTLSNGSLQLSISQDIRDGDKYAWVFKIPYGGAENTT